MIEARSVSNTSKDATRANVVPAKESNNRGKGN